MLVDLAKYKVNLVSIEDKLRKDLILINRPFTATSRKDYSYYVSDLGIYSIKNLRALEYTKKGALIEKVPVRILTRPNKLEIELEDFYTEDEKSSIELPFEYYSRSYIDPIDFQYNGTKINPEPLSFKLDRLDRLHLDSKRIYSFIYAVEKKIPIVKASVKFDYSLFTTLKNQLDLSKKYLNYYFKLEEYENDGLNYLVGSGYAYKTLKSCNQLYLDYFLMHLISIRNLPDIKTYNGTIFRDGSYLIHNSKGIHHDQISYFLLNKSITYSEKYFVKLSTERK